MLSSIKEKRGKTAVTIALLITLWSCGEVRQEQKFENPIEAAIKAEEEKKAWQKEFALNRAFGNFKMTINHQEDNTESRDSIIIRKLYSSMAINNIEEKYEIKPDSIYKRFLEIAQKRWDTTTANWIKELYLDNNLEQ